MIQKKVIIIGAGFGGLATALRLKKKGYNVTILEKCGDAGGRARSFEVRGYQFDAGPTVITAPYLFDELFALFDKNIADYVTIKNLDPVWYRYEYADGSSLDYGEKEFFLKEIEKNFPQDLDGYLELYKKAEEIFFLGYEALADKPFHRFSFMLKQLPALLKLHGFESAYALIGRYIKSDKLRHALCTGPLLLGGNPREASAIYLLIHILEQKYGVHYAMGGTRNLVGAMVQLAQENDVDIRYNQNVIKFENLGKTIQSVVCADGSKYDCDGVVYNGDAAYLYQNILPKKKQSLFTKLRTHFNSPSMGLLVVYFVTNRRYEDIKHHTIGFGNSYNNILDNIFKKQKLEEDFSFYLHRPADTDPLSVPPDKDLFYVLVPVSNLKYKNRTNAEYEEYADLIIKKIESRLLPDLQENIIARHHISPHYFKDTLLSAHGAGFSLQPKLTQSAWFRYHNSDPYYKNLYLVGAGSHPGAGLPGVLNSAKIVTGLMT